MEEEIIISRVDYNPDTGELIWKPRGNNYFDKTFAGRDCTCFDKDGYKVIKTRLNARVRCFQAHRVAWLLYYGEWPDGTIDHIDRDKTNNKIANLRVVTVSQNSRNRSCRKDSVSGYKGVRKLPKGTYRIKICKDGKHFYREGFLTPEEAALAYNDMAKELHGEFAVLNQVKP